MLAGVGLSRLLQVLNAQGLALVLLESFGVTARGLGASAVGIRRTAARTTRSTQRLTAVP